MNSYATHNTHTIVHVEYIGNIYLTTNMLTSGMKRARKAYLDTVELGIFLDQNHHFTTITTI